MQKVRLLAGVIAAVLVVAAIGGYVLTNRILAPRKARQSVEQGNQLLEAQDYEAAARAYGKAVEKDPSNTAAYNGLGGVYEAQAAESLKNNQAEAQSALNKAEQAYRSAIYKERDNAQAWQGLGRVQALQAQTIRQQDPQQARQYYQDAIKSYETLQAIDVRAEQEAGSDQQNAAAQQELEELRRQLAELESQYQELRAQTDAASSQSAATQSEAPAAQTEAPAAQPEAPAAQTEAPAAQPEAPAAQTEAPAAQTEAPAEQSTEVPAETPAEPSAETQTGVPAEQSAEAPAEIPAEQENAQTAVSTEQTAVSTEQTAVSPEQSLMQTAAAGESAAAEEMQALQQETPEGQTSGTEELQNAEPAVLREMPGGLPEKITWTTPAGTGETVLRFDGTDGTMNFEGGDADLLGFADKTLLTERGFFALACSLPAAQKTEYLLAHIPWVKDGTVSHLNTGGRIWDLETDGEKRLVSAALREGETVVRTLTWKYNEAGQLTDIISGNGDAGEEPDLHIEYSGDMPQHYTCSSRDGGEACDSRISYAEDWLSVTVWNDLTGGSVTIWVNEQGAPGHAESAGTAADYVFDTAGRLVRISSGNSGEEASGITEYVYSDSVIADEAVQEGMSEETAEGTSAEEAGAAESAAAAEEGQAAGETPEAVSGDGMIVEETAPADTAVQEMPAETAPAADPSAETAPAETAENGMTEGEAGAGDAAAAMQQ